MKKINVLLALSLAFCFIFPGALYEGKFAYIEYWNGDALNRGYVDRKKTERSYG